MTSPEPTPPDGTTSRVYTPDQTLLRRFGVVRAVGGGAYIIAVAILASIYGWAAWPLVLGIPVLAVVTTLYFKQSIRYPRASVALSLVADAIVLGGAAAFVGGTGSGTAALYVIPIVSGGIILGPAAAATYTGLAVALAWLQLLSEQLGLQPVFLHRPDLGERIVVLLVMTAVLTSVGYLTSTYASRLQDNIAAAGTAADEVRRRTRRRRTYVQEAARDVATPLRAVEAVADRLDDPRPLGVDELHALASQLRMRTTEVAGAVGALADVSAMDAVADSKPQAVQLSKVVADCQRDLRAALADHHVHVDVPPIRVAGDRRAARRITTNLLENVARHTPAGTTVWVEGRTTGGQGVLVVTDDGPGIDPATAARIFDPPDDAVDAPRVGLPLVRELAEAMGAEISYAPREQGGSIFLVGFRLAPRDAPDAADPLDAASRDARPTDVDQTTT